MSLMRTCVRMLRNNSSICSLMKGSSMMVLLHEVGEKGIEKGDRNDTLLVSHTVFSPL